MRFVRVKAVLCLSTILTSFQISGAVAQVVPQDGGSVQSEVPAQADPQGQETPSTSAGQDAPVAVEAQEAPPVSEGQDGTVPAPVPQDDPVTLSKDPAETARGARSGTDGGAKSDIVVTGSLFASPDPSSDVKVYTAQDIKDMGVTNVQDFFRLLPQNQVSIGYGLTNRRQSEIAFDDGGLGALGVGGVNLRGLGTKNTLVLVNGRRIAGAAGIEEGFANINNIPLAAVDRVEITLGGASAIYGAAALGGVVNFVLKRGYRGFSATTRSEHSENGAHTAQATLTGAASWGSGSITGSLSYTRILPALYSKLGWTTENYTDRYSEAELDALGRGNIVLDNRSFRNGAQPATMSTQYYNNANRLVQRVYQWGGGDDYSNPNISQLRPLDQQSLISRIPADAGERQSNFGTSLSLEQRVTDHLRFTVDYLGSYNRSHLREVRELIYLQNVPLTQAYSPFTAADFPSDLIRPVENFSVYYYPDAELADGRLPRGYQRSSAQQHSVTGGVVYEFDKNTMLRANYTWSVSSAAGRQRGMRSVVGLDFFTGVCQPDTFGVESNRLEIPDFDRVAALQCEALTSSDPTKALNFLNDGRSNVGAPASVFSIEQKRLANRSTQGSGDMVFTASPFSLPAGRVDLAIGGEARGDFARSERIAANTLQAARNNIIASYAEVRVPVISDSMKIPGINSLDLTASGRYDRYASNGPVGTVDDIPVDEGGTPVIRDVVFDRISPRIGVAWSPVPSVVVRSAWSSNFSPPPFSSLYDIRANQPFLSFLDRDPLSPDGVVFQFRDIPGTFAANPLLKPETSSSFYVTTTWTPMTTLSGLRVEASYYDTTIRDQIGSTTDLQQLLPPELFYGNREFFTRDADGYIIATTIKPVNIGLSQVKSAEIKVDYSILLPFGTLTPSIYYIRNLRQLQQASAETVAIDRVGTARGMDRYRIISYIDLQTRNLTARFTARYIPPYDNNYGLGYSDGQPADEDLDGKPDLPFRVGSMTTFDLNVNWRYNRHMSITAGGRNIFAARPPFALIDGRPYDASRYDIRGRVLYLEARLDF